MTPSGIRVGAGGRDGFTLVEAVAALTIVGAVLVTGLAAVGADVRASRDVVEARRMAAAAGTALERVALRSRRTLLADPGAWHRLAPPLEDHRWRVRASPAADRPHLLRVTLTVRSAAGGRESLTTLLFRPAPGGSS